MIKKIAISAVAGAVMLASAMPTFAAFNLGLGNGNVSQTNVGGAVNTVNTTSKTGGNSNLALGAGVQGVVTGGATSASNVQNQVNYNGISCGCGLSNINIGFGNGNVAQTNMGMATNTVNTTSKTGGNTNAGALVGVQATGTGAAVSGAIVVNAVNTNMIGSSN
ncbi:MAG TPA: hypothetical protein VHE53_04680 [Patescibacteria group bacterium]|nr:hypothetical protein [Patescibacteria group bacterium]